MNNPGKQIPSGDLEVQVNRMYESKDIQELDEVASEIFTNYGWGKVEKSALGQAYKIRKQELENAQRD